MKVCAIDGCSSKSSARGWCRHHYHTWWRFGDPLAALKSEMSLEQRLAEKSGRVESGCLEWRGDMTTAGYGRMGFNGEQSLVHRLAFQMRYGEIPAGMYVCHTCDNRRCLADEHLFLGTQEDNRTDMLVKGRQNRGERHGLAVLREAQVMAIFLDQRSGIEIAAEFGVSRAHVSQIKAGRRWGFLTAQLRQHSREPVLPVSAQAAA